MGLGFDDAVARAKARGIKHPPNHENGVCARGLFNAPFTHVIPPYLHLILGLVNDAVKEMLVDMTKLGCLNPLAVEQQRERGAMLERLEGDIGAAVGELVDLLGPAQRSMVRGMMAKMDKAAGVAAVQAEAEEVLLIAARAAAAGALADAMASAEDWRARNKDAGDKPRREAQTKRQREAAAAPPPWEPYAQKIEEDAKQAD